MDEKRIGIQAKAEKEICVCAIYTGSKGELFEADSALDLLRLAQLLRARMEQPGAMGPEPAGVFGQRRTIDQDGFDLRTAEFMKGARHIRGMFTIDVQRKKVSALDLLRLAQLLRARMEQPGAMGPEPAGVFGQRRTIDQDGFDLRTAEFMKGARHIRGMFTIDVQRKKVSALDRAEGWMDLQFKDLSAAAYYACRKEGRGEAERRAIFLSRLKGKMLNRPLHPDAELTFGM